jgi:hypothetical protein
MQMCGMKAAAFQQRQPLNDEAVESLPSDEECLAALDSACLAARSRLSCVSLQIRELEQANGALRASLDTALVDAAAAQAEATSLRSDLLAAKAERQASEEKNATLTMRVEQRERAVAQATEAAVAAERAQQRASERTEELEATLRRRDDALVTAASDERAHAAALSAAQKEARAVRESRDAAQREAQRAHTACASLRAKLTERDGRLADVSRAARDALPFADVSNQLGGAGPALVPPSASAPCEGGEGDDAARAAVGFARRVLDATRADASGGALEELCTRILRIALKYTSERVGGGHDRGVDIKLRSSDDVPAVAQWSPRSGSNAVRTRVCGADARPGIERERTQQVAARGRRGRAVCGHVGVHRRDGARQRLDRHETRIELQQP